jgi:hypothetical protein
MKTKLLFLMFLSSIATFAQYTLIPDVNFENKLIDLGIDSGVVDGKVLTNNINTLTSLNVSSSSIANLTGIEDFVALQSLDCGRNQLTNLNVTKNTALTNLYCYYNQITNIDVSQNSKLEWFMCHFNQLTSIDVSNNPKLDLFDCLNNKITSLDISKNPLITELACENNELTYLNLKNGANAILDLTYSNFVNNPNLKCIQVDNIAYSNANWTNIKDATATYSSTCSQLGIEDSVFDKIAIYPNPTKGELHVDNIILEKATVYDSLGKLVKTTTFSSGTNDNTIHLGDFTKGIYYIYLEGEGANTAKKIILE